MDEESQREAVIVEAKSWLRTPHRNGASVKGAGCDCGTYPWLVYNACGLMPPLDDTMRYSPQFHLNKGEEWYLSKAQKFGKDVPDASKTRKGDFALFKVGRVFSHGAIVIQWPTLIHSYVNVGVTIDHGDKGWMAENRDGSPRPVRFFTLW
jgi:cell wall-associated NlpC family hydrolase